MNEGSSQGGFTIIETLIVLAIAGMALTAALFLVAGQQNKVQFNQAIQGLQTTMQQAISEVGSGYYPNANNIRCDGNSGNLNLTAGSREQGTNTGCIFLGKALQFGVKDTDPQQYIVHTVAGLQDNDGTLASARPRAIAPGILTNNTPNFPDAGIKNRLLYGLEAVSMSYTSGGIKRPIGAVAFVSSLGKYEDAILQSGTQQISLVPVEGSAPSGSFDTEPARVADAINNNLDNSPINPDGGVQICFASAGTDQSGLITLGSNNRSVSVKLDIKSGRAC